MRPLRATLLLGTLVLALVWALEMAGVFRSWEVALHHFARLPVPSDPVSPAWLLGLCAAAAYGLAWATVDIPRPFLKCVVAGGTLLQLGTLVYVSGLFGVAFPAVQTGLAASLAFLGGMLYSRTEGGRRKRVLREVLGDRVSPENFRRLVDDSQELPMDGTREQVAVLVCELVHAGEPELDDVATRVSSINRFLAAASLVLARHGGYVAECDGEGLCALFAPPVTPGTAAVAAIEAAFELADHRSSGIDFRIGVEQDEAVLGVFGSGQAGAFGASGPPLDFARRLARWNLGLGTQVLVGPGAHAAAGQVFGFRPATLLTPPACDATSEVYEPLGRADAAVSDAVREARSLYWRGVVRVREARWQDAVELLEPALALSGPDPLCEFHLARAREALDVNARAGSIRPSDGTGAPRVLTHP